MINQIVRARLGSPDGNVYARNPFPGNHSNHNSNYTPEHYEILKLDSSAGMVYLKRRQSALDEQPFPLVVISKDLFEWIVVEETPELLAFLDGKDVKQKK